MKPEKPLVLIADDDAAIHELVEAYLRASGFDVTHALDGREAVRCAQARLPDVIVMDFNLPWLDGCEATKLLKASRRTWNIPLLLWTSEVEARVRKLAGRAGCDAFLTKPCPPARLRQAIVELLYGIRDVAPRTIDDDRRLAHTLPLADLFITIDRRLARTRTGARDA
jgi:CheY-like chemotaxis protein